jgi:hypothetical protein
MSQALFMKFVKKSTALLNQGAPYELLTRNEVAERTEKPRESPP